MVTGTTRFSSGTMAPSLCWEMPIVFHSRNTFGLPLIIIIMFCGRGKIFRTYFHRLNLIMKRANAAPRQKAWQASKPISYTQTLNLNPLRNLQKSDITDRVGRPSCEPPHGQIKYMTETRRNLRSRKLRRLFLLGLVKGIIMLASKSGGVIRGWEP